MNHIAVLELTGKERRKLKKEILHLKKEMEKTNGNLKRKQLWDEYNQKWLENKEKRNQCCEDNKNRRIKDCDFEKMMRAFEQEGYEIELNSALLEKEIETENGFLKRLNCFVLILSFLDGVEKMSIKTSTGGKRMLDLNDVCFLFWNLILEEEKAYLEKEHKIMQLYMLLNGYLLEEENPFYLTKEQKNLTYVCILENREKMQEVEKQNVKMSPNDFSKVLVGDFLTLEIQEVYEHLFGNGDLERKVSKL